MMNIRYLLLLLTLLCFSITLFAAEQDKQKNPEINQQKATKNKPSVGKRARVKTLEEFIPSEEVSADKAVSFPSDI